VDVEGGAATLLVTPAGESVLVDTGNPGERDPGRIAKMVKEIARLERIDHVVITHFHADHHGGLADLARLVPIGTLWERDLASAPEGERSHRTIPAYKEAKVGKRVTLRPGDKLPLKQVKGAAPLAFRIVGADETWSAPAKPRSNGAICKERAARDPDKSDNRNSVVMLVSFGPFRFFDGGDLTWNTEGDLVCPADRVGPVDVFQSQHHGLDQSNNPVLVKTLAPTVTIVNNGPRKGGEPGTFATLKATPSIKAVYQVHRNVRVGPDQNTADDLIANKEETCAGHHIKLSVDPQGKTYAVSVPSTGHEKTYETRKRP
jgi:hypothetical protein